MAKLKGIKAWEQGKVTSNIQWRALRNYILYANSWSITYFIFKQIREIFAIVIDKLIFRREGVRAVPDSCTAGGGHNVPQIRSWPSKGNSPPDTTHLVPSTSHNRINFPTQQIDLTRSQTTK